MAQLKVDADLDYYEFLDVLPSASEKEIKKAYRKKSLKCHPDKNPDNVNAAEEWEKLSKALVILTDKSAKAAYDNVLKAKKASELRNRVLDSKRKKFKEDLEEREASSHSVKVTAEVAARRLAQEIKRLREEGSRILEEEQIRLKQELKEAASNHPDESPKLKMKWKSKKGDESNGGYSEQFLRRCLQQYGDVTHLIISRKKNGSAIVEFSTVKDAENALSNATGLPNNPLQLTWLSGRPARTFNVTTKVETGGDFEKMVLEKMREAERRKTKIASDADWDVQDDGAKIASGVDRDGAKIARGVDRDGAKIARGVDRDGACDMEPGVLNTESSVNEEDKLKQAQHLSKANNEPKQNESPMQFSFQSFQTSESEVGERSTFFESHSETGGFDKRESKLKLDTAEARDFESIAMMKLRRAEERRKLIAQMEKEDA